MFRVSVRCVGLAVFLCACGPAPASADAPLHTPTSYSVLPLDAGFELRAQAQVLRYDAAGRIAQRAEERSGPIELGRLRDSGRWVHALPTQEGFEPLLLTTRVDALGEASRYCERIALEDGRRAMRVAALPPPGIEFNQISPPWPPPLPGGGLARIDGLWDDAYLQGAAARDSEGVVHALALGFGSAPTYSMVSLSPDCEPLGQVPYPRAFDAHPGQEGAYVVASGNSVSSEVWLQRQVGGQPRWSIGFTHLLNLPGLQGARYWVRALEDGSVVVAAAAWAPQDARVQLLRFSAEGELLARGEVEGAHIAALRQDGSRLLLALTEPVQSGAAAQVGGRDLVELSLDFAALARLRLPEGYVHGPVNSAASGLRSGVWLVSDTPAAVLAGENATAQRWGALRIGQGLQLEWLQALGESRPRLLLADGSLLVSQRAEGETRLARRSGAGSEQAVESPTLRPRPDFNTLRSLVLADGAVARLRYRGADLYLDVHEGDALAWSRRVAARIGNDVRDLFSGKADAPICLAAMRGSSPTTIELRCHARADGEPLPVRTWTSFREIQAMPVGLLGESERPALYAVTTAPLPAAGYRLREWGLVPGASGQIVPSARDFEISADYDCALRAFALHPGAGGAVLEQIGGRFRLQRFNADRELLWQTPVPDAWRCPGVLAVAESGEVLVGEFEGRPGSGSPMELSGFAADGRLLWQAPARSVTGPGFVNPWGLGGGVSWFKPGGADYWVANLGEDDRALLSIFSASSGAHRASLRTVREWPESFGWDFAPTADRNQVLLVERSFDVVRARRLDLASARLGPSAELRTPWATESEQALVLGERVESTDFAADSPAIRQVRSITAPSLAPDQPVGAEHSGQWYDPQSTGQGLFLDVEAGTQRWFASWFTYMASAEAGSYTAAGLRRRLRWHSMLGQGDAASGMHIAGTLYSTGGGRFDGGTPQTAPVGQAFLRAIDCNTLEFAYAIPDPDDAAAPVLTGARRLQRLGPAPAACGGTSLAEQSGLRAASTGSWVLEGRPNQGLLMQVDPGAAGQAGALWGAWFGFDAGEPDDALAQHWLTVIGRSAAGQPGVVELEWMRTLGGSFDAQPTRNTRVIGSGRLRFTACDRAVLEYSFDAPGLPGDAFAGLQGQVNLRRFESCR